MPGKEFSGRLNLMEAIIKENWLRTTVHRYVSLQQEGYCSVELKINKSSQAA
jgi:hypothetical protein